MTFNIGDTVELIFSGKIVEIKKDEFDDDLIRIKAVNKDTILYFNINKNDYIKRRGEYGKYGQYN